MEATSSRVGQELQSLGFAKVYVLAGGWKAWEEKEYPTVPKQLD
jgi:3-mercaptopyruvate sulfurtransferase SseA